MGSINFLAMSGGEATQGDMFGSMLPFILIIVIIYFFMIRPQAKKAKQQREMISALKTGDKVVTIGGFHGKIVEVKDATFMINIGKDNIVEINKDSVSAASTTTEKK
ncbi:MAG: preprotein translocase subunit YajC [Candidatus Delongbacteria bacterium]|nr:preprotein translocase subunit YajC [Candidatus Delongbacteria bacterium]MBN2836214.1 preprotein translocase subunit YajC [Candidatus Delongbacteria bacterium]